MSRIACSKIIPAGENTFELTKFPKIVKKDNSVVLFHQKQVRRHWDEQKELWYFSIVDVIEILTDSVNPIKYWSVLKTRLKKEGSEVASNCSQLKLMASDGKKYLTDVADTETILRLIQSIPSPKAEPFKLWLAKVGYERIEETEDPELAFERAMKTYLKKGYSKAWINQRLKSIEIRKELTDEWKSKGLKKQNLRDNMTNLEPDKKLIDNHRLFILQKLCKIGRG